MKKRTLVLGAVVVLVAAGIAVAAKRGELWSGGGAVAQAPRPSVRAIPVEIAVAAKRTVPVRIEALGSVTPIASVAIKARIDSEIVGVHFRDGAMVREGEPLFTLDSRALQAQIRQVQGLLEGAKAQLEQAERDVARYTELIAKNATTQVTLNNARTQVTIWRASVDSNTGQLENLNIQLSYCTIRAPISGRVSMAAVKVGNFVRQADLAPLATIIQTAPVYVTFSVPQGYLPDLRQALTNESATIEAVIPGDARRATRTGHDDREQRRRTNRNGARSRHHAEHRRTALARDVGDRAADVPRGGSRHRALDRRSGQPERHLRVCRR